MRGSAIVVLLCVLTALACHVMTDDARAHAADSDFCNYPAFIPCHAGDDQDDGVAAAGDPVTNDPGDADAAAAPADPIDQVIADAPR